jgi:hypothetical protein
MKIGTIAMEMDIAGVNLIEGSRSRITAKAAKKDASIKAISPSFFIKKFSPFVCINAYLKGELFRKWASTHPSTSLR